MLTFLGIAAVALVAGLAWTGNLTKVNYLTKGIVSIFIDNKIKTVEGAKAVFNTAIEEAKSSLDDLAGALQNISGQRQLMEKDIKSLQQQLPELTKKCEQLVAAGKKDEALPYALKYESLHIELKGKMDALPVLIQNEEEAKSYVRIGEQKILELKQERDQIIQEIQLNKTVAEANNSMASIRSKMPTKMLETVREGAREAQKNALGSATVRNTMMTSKLDATSEAVNRMNANAFLDSLEQKVLPAGKKKTTV